MTMVPIWKNCPVCHKKYDWNPDVGHFNCPYCHGLGTKKKTIFDKLFGKTDKKASEKADTGE